jgi:intracellular septation protein A
MTESEACWSLFEAFFTIPKQTWNELTLSNTLYFFFAEFLLRSLRAPILFDRNLLGTL